MRSWSDLLYAYRLTGLLYLMPLSVRNLAVFELKRQIKYVRKRLCAACHQWQLPQRWLARPQVPRRGVDFYAKSKTQFNGEKFTIEACFLKNAT